MNKTEATSTEVSELPYSFKDSSNEVTKIENRFHEALNKLVRIEKEYGHYNGFLADGTSMGNISITPESKTAFENEDWQFFNFVFGLIF
jgi:hypothetical protein